MSNEVIIELYYVYFHPIEPPQLKIFMFYLTLKDENELNKNTKQTRMREKINRGEKNGNDNKFEE